MGVHPHRRFLDYSGGFLQPLEKPGGGFRLAGARVPAHEFMELLSGPIPLALLGIHQGQVVARRGVLRGQAKGPFQRSLGFLQPPQDAQGVAQVIVG